MSRIKSCFLCSLPVLLSSVLLAACGDEGLTPSPDAGVGDAGGNADVALPPDGSVLPNDGGGDAVVGDGGDATPLPLAFVPKGMVVLHGSNDYTSTSISFTDLTGTVRLDDCLHTGSTPAGLTTALTGDVALSSMPLPNGEVILLDRQTAVLTFVNPANCAVKRQIKLGSFVGANPHDFAWISDTKAYVTRYESNVNPTPAPGDLDDGSDVLILNPLTGALEGRIDLMPWAVPAPGNKILPRADRILMLGNKTYVTLQNISADFTKVGEGKGRIVVIDTATNKVDGAIDLPGVNNCGAMQATGPQTIVVACGGPYSTTRLEKTAASAIVLINVATKTIVKTVTGPQIGNPVSLFSIAAVGERFFAIVPGDFGDQSGPPDHLFTGTFAGELPTSAAMSATTGDFGTALIHPTLPKLFVTDVADMGKKGTRIRVFNTGTSPALTPEAPILVGNVMKFPVRSIAWF